jgi:asparagine N-glycosylation enzyme membrane subunit Stt3
MNTQAYSKYPAKWQERFAFLDAHGAPGTPSYKDAFKALPFMQRIKIGSSILAFFFGPIYFFILGLWRKALVGLALTVATCVVAFILYAVLGPESRGADFISRMLGLAVTLMYAGTANYAYYLKEVKGQDSWNFFEGLRM